MSKARYFEEFINTVITELYDNGIMNGDKFTNYNEYTNWLSSSYCSFREFSSDRSYGNETKDTTDNTLYKVKGRFDVYNLLENTTMKNIKNINTYKKKSNGCLFISAFWTDYGDILYACTSYKYPMYVPQNYWCTSRTQEIVIIYQMLGIVLVIEQLPVIIDHGLYVLI